MLRLPRLGERRYRPGLRREGSVSRWHVSAAAERTERSVATPGHALESYLERFEAHSRTPGTEAKGSRARIKVESASIRARSRRCGRPSPRIKSARNIGSGDRQRVRDAWAKLAGEDSTG